MQFIQQFINGVHVGSIYALIALGYTMVYGIVKLINFAHGEIMMLGAYVGFFAIGLWGLPFPLALLVAMVFSALLGVVIERIAYKPLRNAPRISALITAIGMSLLLQNIALVLFGPDPQKMPAVISKEAIHLGSIQISYLTIVTLVLAVGFMILLELFIKRTKTGKAMRAVSQDKAASTLMGIDVNRIISVTFAIGSALGALGGVLYAVAYPQVEPYMGIMPGLKAFVAAVLGGIGSIPGAMIGGFILGIMESLTKGYISSQWSDAVVFGVLILVLLIKPSGLLGKNTREKV